LNGTPFCLGFKISLRTLTRKRKLWKKSFFVTYTIEKNFFIAVSDTFCTGSTFL